MTSTNVVRLGSQMPTILHSPSGVASLAGAEEVIELADRYEICDGNPLCESQRIRLRNALGERADGKWSAKVVGDFGPRQGAGKTDIIHARELAGLHIIGEQLLIHTAHEFPTTNESFLRMHDIHTNWDDLAAKVERFRYGHGEQAVELFPPATVIPLSAGRHGRVIRRHGSRLLYRARTKGAGRGYKKADLVVYDEAQEIQAEHQAASAPTKMANPNAMSWYAGSGGLPYSGVAWKMRKQALKGSAGRLAYAESTAERVTMLPDGTVRSARPRLDDVEAWYRAIPGLGIWVTEETVESLLRDELTAEVFGREILCMWAPDASAEAGEDAIDATTWAALADPDSKIASHYRIALDVTSTRPTFSAFGVAGKRDDGRVHVECIESRRGTGWVAEVGAAISRARDCSIIIQDGSPAAAFKADIVEAGGMVTAVSGTQHAEGVGSLLSRIESGTLAHRGAHDPDLQDAVDAAELRGRGDVQVWDRKAGNGNIAPLVAVTLASRAVPDDDAYDLDDLIQ